MRRIFPLVILSVIALGAVATPLLAANATDPLAAGRAALDRGDYDQAVDLLTKAATAQPKDAQPHYLLGRTYGEMAQKASMFKQASFAKQTRAEFERAVELDPNLIDARMSLVSFYLMAPGFMGGGEDKALEQAAEIKKRDAIEGHRAYARVHTHNKKTDLARKEFVDAVRENPTSARAHYLLAGFLMNDKNWTGSLHELEMSLKLDPAYMPTYLRIGQYAARSGTIYPRGEESLRKYLGYKPAETEPSLAAAWYWLGQLQEKQGKKAEARQSYLNGQKLAPTDTDIQAALKKL